MDAPKLYLIVMFLLSVACFYWALDLVKRLRKITKKDYDTALKRYALFLAFAVFALNAGYQAIYNHLPQLALHPVDFVGAFLCSYLLSLSVLNTVNKKSVPLRELLYASFAIGLSGYLLLYFYHIACGATNVRIHFWLALFALFITCTTAALVMVTTLWLKGYNGKGYQKLQMVFAVEIALGLLASHTAINLSIINTTTQSALAINAADVSDNHMTLLLVLVPILLFMTSFILVIFYERMVDVTQSKLGFRDTQYGSRRQLSYDPLTNLPNRDALNQHLIMTTKRCDRNKESMALAYIDLDHFKPVNDQFGHHIGDLLLIEASKRISNAIRNCDYVARAGGDEFIAVFSEIENQQSLVAAVQRVVDALREPFFIEGHTIEISCSIGVSIYPHDGNLEKLKVSADAAMYKAKQNGKNQYRFFDAEIEQASDEMQQTRLELKQAISQREFKLLYQPKVDSITRKVLGAEALLRWQHPVRGLLTPASFIEPAERFGLIEEINEWVISQACETIHHANKMGIELSVSVNLANQQFRNKYLGKHIQSFLEAQQVEARHLILEVSETNAIHHQEQFRATLSQFKALGIRVSLDDFGLHAFSVSYLQNLAINEVKLDKSLTKQVAHTTESRSIVEAIVLLAHALSLNVVAEGVEDEAQAQALAKIGCNELQGYLFSKPVEREQFFEIFNDFNI